MYIRIRDYVYFLKKDKETIDPNSQKVKMQLNDINTSEYKNIS